MNDVRVVNFCGDELTVVKMFDDGKIYVSVRTVCKSLGMDENQIKTQRLKVSIDPVLEKGRRAISIPTNGGLQEIICLDLEFVPIWMAKINANILEENVKNKLIEYQLNAKEVLSKVFIHQQAVLPKNQSMGFDIEKLNPETQALVMLVNSIAQTQLEQQRIAVEITNVKKDVQSIRDVYAISSEDSSWRERTNNIINGICRSLGDYKGPKDQIYDKLNERARCNINLRVQNMKMRATANGMPVSQANQLNKLDAIAADPRLKEIYIQIVKEFAIFHGYSREDIADI